MNYRLATTLTFDGDLPQRNHEACYSPDGTQFCISQSFPEYPEASKIRIFDSRTFEQKRVIDPRTRLAPGAEPHGIFFAENHIIAGMKKKGSACPLLVYALGDDSSEAAFMAPSPRPYLREVHSIDMKNGILVATYCENEHPFGALVSYRFDSDSGEISDPVSVVETSFTDIGDAKGISFSACGTRVYASFNSPRESGLKNGIAAFDIAPDGVIDPSSARYLFREDFCRLESVHVVDDMLVLSDTINNSVSLYNLEADPSLSRPLVSVAVSGGTPHSAKLSSKKNQLVITTLGHPVVDQTIQWRTWNQPRTDHVHVYELH